MLIGGYIPRWSLIPRERCDPRKPGCYVLQRPLWVGELMSLRQFASDLRIMKRELGE